MGLAQADLQAGPEALVDGVADHLDPVVSGGQRLGDFVGGIAAGVVDDQNFAALKRRNGHRLDQPMIKGFQVVGLVMACHHHGDGVGDPLVRHQAA